MESRRLEIDGAWLFTPTLRQDDRGVFLEAFKSSIFTATTGRTFDLKQMNTSVSKSGTIRGIHFADVPPGQAKYIQCYQGRILDVIVDVRVGSPTFGQWVAVELDDQSRQGLFIAEGLGHAFCALSDSAIVGYLCSEEYAPNREHGVHPLDPDLDIPWPSEGNMFLSTKDASAPTLREAEINSQLPLFSGCT